MIYQQFLTIGLPMNISGLPVKIQFEKIQLIKDLFWLDS